SSSEQVLPGQSASLPQAFPTFTPATQLEQNFLSAPYGKVPEPGVGATLTLQTFGLAPLGGVTVPIAVLLRMIVDPGPPGLHVCPPAHAIFGLHTDGIHLPPGHVPPLGQSVSAVHLNPGRSPPTQLRGQTPRPTRSACGQSLSIKQLHRPLAVS